MLAVLITFCFSNAFLTLPFPVLLSSSCLSFQASLPISNKDLTCLRSSSASFSTSPPKFHQLGCNDDSTVSLAKVLICSGI